MIANEETSDALVERESARTWFSDWLPYMIAGTIAVGLLITMIVMLLRKN
jgi:hypothetical protein